MIAPMKMQPPKGLFDVVPHPKDGWRASALWRFAEDRFSEIALRYGFQEIRTPIFEQTELFSRGVGEGTDVVAKEMYTFEDKAGRSLSLRPEGTAPVIRALISEGLLQGRGQKLFYSGPMFRYERQQAGRYRQHHQFGAEIVGDDAPERDAELIDMLLTFYKSLGLKNLTLMVNSLGDHAAREAYRAALKDYLRQSIDQLSEESQRRFETNPLRILDSKNERDQELLREAPSILDFLDPSCQAHFEQVQARLTQLGITYVVEPHLVRGLDYYTRTVFEVTAEQLGAQNSVGGGGRYDTLIEKLGGPATPALGFGTGVERILQTMIGQGVAPEISTAPTVLLLPLGDRAKDEAFGLLKKLRDAGVSAEMDLSGKKLKQQMRLADQLGVPYAAVIGDEELEKGVLELKAMATHTTEDVPLEGLVERLRR
jgi:histidyl-tRNA synthetase